MINEGCNGMGIVDLQCMLICAREDGMDVIVGRNNGKEWEYDEVDIDSLMNELYIIEDRFIKAYEDGSRIICEFEGEVLTIEVW